MYEIPFWFWYIILGFFGGATYVAVMKLWGEKAETARRILLGGAAGFIVYLIVWASQPEYLEHPLAYLLALFSAYWAVDFIESIASRYKPTALQIGDHVTVDLGFLTPESYPNYRGFNQLIQEKITAGKPTGKPAIQLFVSKKLPESELKTVLPKEIKGIPTDVIQVGEVLAV